MPIVFPNRDRRRDLLKLATAILEECAARCPFGLDEKRPLGFSGPVAPDVCTVVGLRPVADEWTAEQLEYADELWGEVGLFIVSRWKENVR